MAAIIIALKKAKSKETELNGEASHGSGAGVKVGGRTTLIGLLDIDGDGKLSADEILDQFSNLSVRVETMLERLQLERDLSVMLRKLPMFLLCLICFLLALCELSPAAAIFNAHRHIRHQFSLSRIGEYTDWSKVYDYIEYFESQNTLLQAASSKYWCESRYSEHIWDEAIEIPRWECRSPRLYSLSLHTDAQYSWSELNGNSTTETSSHRRLKQNNHRERDNAEPSGVESRRARRASSTGSSTGSSTSCSDDDEGLQLHEGSATLTCEQGANYICNEDLGLKYCRSTCGYCAPFTYKHSHLFTTNQVTLLPAMVFQKRHNFADCIGFAEKYQHQDYNDALSMLPPLDGKREGDIISCVDRTSYYEGEYAMSRECPASIESSLCHHGERQLTKKHTFHGEPIYPEIMIEPRTDILRMIGADWLDRQTQSVSLSTMIYTVPDELFTSLTVVFSVDRAGNVDGTFNIISYRDIIQGSKTTFIVCLVLCSLGAVGGVVISAIEMMKDPANCKWGSQAFELFSRVILLVYPLILLISWSQQDPMSDEFDQLLHTFLNMKGIEDEDVDEVITHYFEVKDHIYAETQWLKSHRIVAYVVCYIQFYQLILYFSAHPKMGVLTATIAKAWCNLVHFFMLFAVLFLMLGFMAHWMLGEYIDEFGSFGGTIASQTRMMFGEFIYAAQAADLSGTMQVMYWIYAISYLLVVWVLLLNFVLAIVVDAFADVKTENEAKVAARSFITDVSGMFWTRFLAARHRWPPRSRLLDYFEQMEACKVRPKNWIDELATEQEDDMSPETRPVCTPEEMLTFFPSGFSEVSLSYFLAHYFSKTEKVLCRRAYNKVYTQNNLAPEHVQSDAAEHRCELIPASRSFHGTGIADSRESAPVENESLQTAAAETVETQQLELPGSIPTPGAAPVVFWA